MGCLSIIFSGANLTMRISEYLKLTDSMSSRISRLEKMYQKSARMAFDAALRTSDDYLRRHHLLEALTKYRDAASVEIDDHSLFCIYFGIACCHGFLNDNANRNVAITKALDYYNRIKCDANKEPEGFIEMQSGGDEGAEVILQAAYAVATLCTANLINSGVKKVQSMKINRKKEEEKNIRDVASQLRSYI